MKVKWENEEDKDQWLVDTDTGRIIGGISGPSWSTSPQEWFAWVNIPERKNLGQFTTRDYAKKATEKYYWTDHP